MIGQLSVLLGRLWRHSLRQPAVAYVLPAAMPLGLLVFITQLYGAMVDGGGYPVDDMLDWMGPGIVFLAVCMGGGFTGSLLVTDAESGFLDRMRLLPIRRATVVVACLLFEAIRIVPVGVVLYGAAGLLGLSLPSPLEMAVVLALAALWAAAWNAMFLLASLRTQNAQLSLVLLPLFLPFFLGSTMMVPRHLLPGYVQALVSWNPLDRFVVAVRPFFLDGPADASAITGAVLASTALLVVLGGLAHREYARLSG
ncbi:MAG: ABC transporter permease [Acidimicrobiales bacterium]